MDLVIFDTNAWLNLYTIYPQSLSEIIPKFSQEKGLFWIPEQVYWEFGNHVNDKRKYAIDTIDAASKNARKHTNDAKDKVTQELCNLRNNVILSDTTIISSIEAKFSAIHTFLEQELEKLDQSHRQDTAIIAKGHDIVQKLIDDIYSYSPPYLSTAVQRIKLYEEGELRVKYHIPPGLTDTEKSGSDPTEIYRRRYGDFLIWKDVLRKTEELIHTLSPNEKLHVIFVEEEKKGDWWIERGKRVISPVLEEEFDSVANGKADIEMVNFVTFLQQYGSIFGIEDATICALVTKNRYKETVIAEINSQAYELLTTALNTHYSSPEAQKTLFENNVLWDDVIFSVSDFTLNVIDVRPPIIDEDGHDVCVTGAIKFVCVANLTKNFDNDHTEQLHVRKFGTAFINLKVSIDYSQGYETARYNISDAQVEFRPRTIQRRIRSLKQLHEVRSAVFERDNFTCQICGYSSHDGAELCIDHIIPYSQGGSDELDNLQTLCTRCNRSKADKIM